MSEKDKEKERIEEIRRIIRETQPSFKFPGESEGIPKESKEYREFKEEEIREPTLYEKLCKFSEFLNVEPDKELKEEMQRAIDFAHLMITPKGAFSFAILSSLLFIIFSIILLLLTKNLVILLSMMAGSLLIIYFLVKYPSYLAQRFRLEASEEIILAVIYMVIYMRASPNLEGAIRFAARNLSGPLAYDLRKILWDLEVRKYENIYDAIEDYLEKWKGNNGFIEAMHLIRTSLEQPEARRHALLDEAVTRILDDTRENMKHYTQSLRLPVMLIYALGITLPILLLIMFPILFLMLSESINPVLLVVGYDIVLPSIIYYVTIQTLRRRPMCFSAPDISLHPKYSPLGKIKIGDRLVPLWPFGAAISFVLIFFGANMMLKTPSKIDFLNLIYSMIIVWGIGIGVSLISIIDSRSKNNIRQQIVKIQSEFAEVLFQFGHRLALGSPMEKAMEETVEKESNLSISEMFRKALDNMNRAGLALEPALFDRKFGAVWDYPSKMVINVMRVILEASKKGVRNAALSAMAISRYVKHMKITEEELKDMLSETTTSMKFLAMFLAPLISGITTTMAAVMMMIFSTLRESLSAIQTTEVSPNLNVMLISGWGGVGETISIGVFQLIVGIYLIEVCILLAILINGIENGLSDKVGEKDYIGWTLLIGLIVYTFSLFGSYYTFAPMIKNLLVGGIA
ncbi:MAG: hypothetical protein J7L45_00320 [Candidatus Aenigmarchaeota archaeon]|nr:hypothetical protein [Candidatus Aenigmarchaeota archaeon]